MTSATAPAKSSSDFVFPSLGLAALVVGTVFLGVMLLLATIGGIAGGEIADEATSDAYSASSDRYGWAAVFGAVGIWAVGAVLAAFRIRSRAKAYALVVFILNLLALLFVAGLTALLQLSGSL